ncbi:Abi family protein [bacterium]|nr:Abi family protein [bacterium]
MNILSKSFVPLYKSFTQISFGNIIEFFCKLNENIQVKLIEEYFPSFYNNIRKLSRNNKNFALVLISTFISFLNVFKNLRNKVAHHDVIYNF